MNADRSPGEAFTEEGHPSSERVPGRILALDVGKKRIGLALSDPLGVTTRGLPTLTRKNGRVDVAILRNLCQEQQVALLLVGEPRHMIGDDSPQAHYTREFAERLSEATHLPVQYRDERLTSVEAEQKLSGDPRANRKQGQVDQMAALVLLQGYLQSLDPHGFLLSEEEPWLP